MSCFAAAKARRVLAALLRIGWAVKRQSGSHRTLSRSGWPDVAFAFSRRRGARAGDARTHRQADWLEAGRSLTEPKPAASVRPGRRRRGRTAWVKESYTGQYQRELLGRRAAGRAKQAVE
jgi:HicA toxin of bacterial toxin-antitoxin,